MTFYPDERFAIFIDGANFYGTVKSLDFDIDYKALLDYFKKKGRLIRANYYTALRENDDYSPLRPLLDWLDYNGFHIITKSAKTFVDREGRTRTKGDMDIEIALGMIELAPHVDHIVLFSGDGDFRAVVDTVQRKGVRVTVVSSMIGKPSMLSDELRRQANDFIEIDDLAEAVGRPKRNRYEDEDGDDDDFGYE
jgi:uncharacterized LabA/DUF88 family protein